MIYIIGKFTAITDRPLPVPPLPTGLGPLKESLQVSQYCSSARSARRFVSDELSAPCAMYKLRYVHADKVAHQLGNGAYLRDNHILRIVIET